ncbi:MAG: imelysin family protein [Leptospiraceae bacterium]|nr:imelysin family protein [Leptospiraceae bacterium]
MKKLILILFITILSGCSSNNNSTTDSSYSGLLANYFTAFNAKPSLKNISENFIYNNYLSLQTSIDSLKTLTTNLSDSCGGDSTKLTELQTSWKSAYATLKKVEIVQFGPSASYSTIDAWPLNYLTNPPNTSSIETTISGSDTISETTLTAKSDSENGFGTIEYLLFTNNSGATDAATICGTLTGRRKTYLQEATKLLYTRVARIKYNWDPSNSGNFSTILQTAGPTNEFYKSDKEALDNLIKQIVTIVEVIKDYKVGYPAGLSSTSGGTVRSSNIESRYANQSILNIQYNLEGIQLYYIGNSNGPGIADYVDYYNPSLDIRIKEKITATINKSKEISNLKTEIDSGSLTKIRELITLLNDLKIIFSVELAGNLGSTFSPGLGDGDGD